MSVDMSDLILTGNPVGTLRELHEHNLDPKVVPCCGPHIEGQQNGCVWWSNKKKTCMFRAGSRVVPKELQFRDMPDGQGGKGIGPENIGFKKQLPNGIKQGYEMACYTFMANEYELFTQREATGVKYEGFYAPGTTIKQRVHVPKHPTPDKNCPKCKKGECSKSERKDIPLPITKHVRLADLMTGDQFMDGDDMTAPMDVIPMGEESDKKGDRPSMEHQSFKERGQKLEAAKRLTEKLGETR